MRCLFLNILFFSIRVIVHVSQLSQDKVGGSHTEGYGKFTEVNCSVMTVHRGFWSTEVDCTVMTADSVLASPLK